MMTVAQFDSHRAALKWARSCGAGRAVRPQTSTSSQPDFFKALDGFITSIPIDDWKTLLRWRVLNTSATPPAASVRRRELRVPRRSSRARRSACRAGSAACATRTARSAKRSARSTSKRTFTPEAKARAKAMVDNLRRGAARPDRPARLDERPTKHAGARASSTRSRARSATPTSGATTRARGRRAGRTTERQARRRVRTRRATGPRSASRSTAPSGA